MFFIDAVVFLRFYQLTDAVIFNFVYDTIVCCSPLIGYFHHPLYYYMCITLLCSSEPRNEKTNILHMRK